MITLIYNKEIFMTNKELFYNFQMIENENDNIFDKYCALYKLTDLYKTTEFYELYSDFSVVDAYNLYIADTTSIGHLIRDFKNHDLPSLTNVLSEKLDMTNVLGALDENTASLLKTILERQE